MDLDCAMDATATKRRKLSQGKKKGEANFKELIISKLYSRSMQYFANFVDVEERISFGPKSYEPT
jgi:hypothetical protein